jgi:hypothetical protein
VSRILWPAVGLAAATGTVLPAVAALLPERRLGVADAGLLIAAGLGLVAAVRAVLAAVPPAPRRRAQRPAAGPSHPAELERLERQVLFTETSGLDAQRLRLALREVAAHRLATRHAVDLDADPAAARELLGPELWAAVGRAPDRQADRDGPRLDPAELGRLLDLLERT